MPGVQAGDDKDADERHGHASDRGNCHGFGYLGTSAGFPEEGDEADKCGGGRHHAWSYPFRACHQDCVTDVLDAFHLSFAKQIVNIGGNKDRIVIHNTKDRDKAYPDGNTEVITK